ncbi:class I SAM-dependent methyltransferase [Dokdonella sp.]|uniref:class I SAM-dependent methyltransferase n=1 Tax=Dokdonella sp. TaxID=2291710 RepID=UPI001B0DB3E9|nr:class I SAM-dependent methyltransferase [Dokdonella sp.]MBO9662111.1 class I SAM-dependent methyltransferase [Dokdonella sp.]
MSRLEALRNDAAVLARLLRGMPRAASHADALGAFYGPQSQHYDRFRERLLAGRAELIGSLPLPERAHVVELGGGTGRNAEFFGDRLARIERFEVVDLCRPLLAQARERAQRVPQLHAVEADATTYRPAQPVDCVFFSYALTMIPDWRGAIANAIAMLKPGGVLGVVDFYVSPARSEFADATRHSALTRAFWPAWFRHDGVRLDAEHLTTLRRALPPHEVVEARAPVPYLPLGRVPYYRFIGRKAG